MPNSKARLFAVRRNKNFTQRQLAAMSGVSQTRVSQLENKVLDPNYVELLALCAILGALPEKLFSQASIERGKAILPRLSRARHVPKGTNPRFRLIG